MPLDERQQKQIEFQIREHQKFTSKYELTPPLKLAPRMPLPSLMMHPHVLQPMSSRHLASYLFQNPKLFHDKTVIDMGSGSGVLGLVCAMHGASQVILSDISPHAHKNTLENVKLHRVAPRCHVLKGDLFERVESDAELIIFAQPYFPGRPIKGIPVTLGMLDEGELIHRFFDQAKDHMKGVILMPYLEWVGPVNNPAVQAPKHGLKVERVYERRVRGVQSGNFIIYKVTRGKR